MTTQDLINTLRQGAPVTARQARAIVSQLERIPAMERTIAAKDHDFAQLSVAYSAAIAARVKSSGEIILTNEESEAVEYALAESDRLKDAVRWERECRGVWTWLNNTLSNVRADLEIQRSTLAASKAVGELL